MSAPQLKQIACLRRKSNLTRKEFFDYHFQVHGSISDEPTDVDQKPQYVPASVLRTEAPPPPSRVFCDLQIASRQGFTPAFESISVCPCQEMHGHDT